MPNISTLVTDIQKLFDDGHDMSSAVEKFGSELATLVASRFKAYGEQESKTLRLSNIGWPSRKLYYSVNGAPAEKLPADAKTKFLYGDVLECLFILLCKEAGHTVERMQEEVNVDGVVGHIDAVVDGVLVDFKSCSTRSYQKFISSDLYVSDPFGYVAQLSSYRSALSVENAGWFIIDKTLGSFNYVPLRPTEGRDIKSIVQNAKQVTGGSIIPEKCYPDKSNDRYNNRVLDIGCSYCQFKSYCWRDSNAGKGLIVRQYSTGPRFFTSLVKEPRLKQSYTDTDTVTTWDTFPVKDKE